MIVDFQKFRFDREKIEIVAAVLISHIPEQAYANGVAAFAAEAMHYGERFYQEALDDLQMNHAAAVVWARGVLASIPDSKKSFLEIC